jgi:hypothetical protein
VAQPIGPCFAQGDKLPPFAVKREFCRRLFRHGGASAETRHSFLDGLSDAALKARQDGKTLVGTASGGTSATFQSFATWRADEVLELIDAARDWADEDDVDDALVLIAPPARSYGPDFSRLRV